MDYVTIKTKEFDLEPEHPNLFGVSHWVSGLGYRIHTVLRVDGYYHWLLEKES